MAENQTGEKTEEATPRRKQEARKKGTVTKSQEVNGAMAMLVLAFVLPPMVKNFGSSLIEIFRTSFASIPRDITPESMGGFVTSIGKPLLIAGLPVFAILMVVGVAVNFAQVGFVLSAESMKPTAEKINPVAGLKRMIVTHSEIFPGTFASTTETADWLLAQLGVKRKPVVKWGPMQTQQLSETKAGKFWLIGFAGNSAPDHVDQLHSLPEYLNWLR